MSETTVHPERFDPAESAGTLMDAEHRCRYWWAARAAIGKDVLDAACGTGYGSLILAEAGARSVTGIDISPEAVSAAQRRLGERGSIVQGDVAELPFEDDMFDLVVCLETIEHVVDGAAVLAEFRRVLRPDGVLLVSSPNPGVYPAGNEHHVHEYSPSELADLIGGAFPNAVEYVQHPWVASSIEPSDVGRTTQGVNPAVKALEQVEPGEQTYTILAAGASEPPELAALIALGKAFEVHWWSQQLKRERADLRRTQQQLQDVNIQFEEAQVHLREAQAHAAKVEQHFTRELTGTFAREQAAGKRLSEANERIVKASEELGRLQGLEEHYRDLKRRNEELGTHYQVAVTRLREIEASRPWKLVEALRRFRARF